MADRSTSPTNITIAVIVPTYNGAEFIAEQLEALLGQSYDEPWHLIVVDNGSTDGTVGIVESFRPTAVPLTVLQLGEAIGVNAAINAGIRATDCEVFLIAEHDDVVADGWMHALVIALQDCTLVGSRIDKDRLNSRTVVGSRRSFPEDPRALVTIANATGMGLRRSLWQRLGGFDESYRYGGNDAEFCIRAIAVGHSPVIIDDATVHYRIRGSASAAFRQGSSYGRSTVRLYRQFGQAVVGRRPLRHFLREVLRLMWWSIRAIFDESYRMLFAYRGGLQLGYLRGSIEYRRLFL